MKIRNRKLITSLIFSFIFIFSLFAIFACSVNFQKASDSIKLDKTQISKTEGDAIILPDKTPHGNVKITWSFDETAKTFYDELKWNENIFAVKQSKRPNVDTKIKLTSKVGSIKRDFEITVEGVEKTTDPINPDPTNQAQIEFKVGNKSVKKITVTKGELIPLDLYPKDDDVNELLKKEHKVFDYWYYKENNQENKVDKATFKPDKDLKLFSKAKEEEKFNVVFNFDGGKIGAEESKTIQIYKGEKISDNIPNPTKLGSILNGWELKGEVKTEELVKEIVVTENLEFKAIWKTARQITINFNLHGGTINGQTTLDQRQVYEQTNLNLVNPLHPDSKGRFKFWSLSETDQKAFDVTKVVVDENTTEITLHAIYDKLDELENILKDDNLNKKYTFEGVVIGFVPGKEVWVVDNKRLIKVDFVDQTAIDLKRKAKIIISGILTINEGKYVISNGEGAYQEVLNGGAETNIPNLPVTDFEPKEFKTKINDSKFFEIIKLDLKLEDKMNDTSKLFYYSIANKNALHDYQKKGRIYYGQQKIQFLSADEKDAFENSIRTPQGYSIVVAQIESNSFLLFDATKVEINNEYKKLEALNKINVLNNYDGFDIEIKLPNQIDGFNIEYKNEDGKDFFEINKNVSETIITIKDKTKTENISGKLIAQLETYQKEFEINFRYLTQDEKNLKKCHDNLTLPDEVQGLTSELTLPDATEGCTIIWSSGALNIVGNKATLTDNSGKLDKTVSISAIIKKGTFETRKDFVVRFVYIKTEQDFVDEAKARLTVPAEVEGLDGKLVLPSKDSVNQDVTITWECAELNLTDLNNVVLNNQTGTDDINVTLKATIAKGTTNSVKEFNVKFKYIDPSQAKLETEINNMVLGPVVDDSIKGLEAELALIKSFTSVPDALFVYTSIDNKLNIATDKATLKDEFIDGTSDVEVKILLVVTKDKAKVQKEFQVIFKYHKTVKHELNEVNEILKDNEILQHNVEGLRRDLILPKSEDIYNNKNKSFKELGFDFEYTCADLTIQERIANLSNQAQNDNVTITLQIKISKGSISKTFEHKITFIVKEVYSIKFDLNGGTYKGQSFFKKWYSKDQVPKNGNPWYDGKIDEIIFPDGKANVTLWTTAKDDPNTAYDFYSSNNKMISDITLYAYYPNISSIKDVITNKKTAPVKGVVIAIEKHGFYLADKTGVIFVYSYTNNNQNVYGVPELYTEVLVFAEFKESCKVGLGKNDPRYNNILSYFNDDKNHTLVYGAYIKEYAKKDIPNFDPDAIKDIEIGNAKNYDITKHEVIFDSVIKVKDDKLELKTKKGSITILLGNKKITNLTDSDKEEIINLFKDAAKFGVYNLQVITLNGNNYILDKSKLVKTGDLSNEVKIDEALNLAKSDLKIKLFKDEKLTLKGINVNGVAISYECTDLKFNSEFTEAELNDKNIQSDKVVTLIIKGVLGADNKQVEVQITFTATIQSEKKTVRLDIKETINQVTDGNDYAQQTFNGSKILPSLDFEVIFNKNGASTLSRIQDTRGIVLYGKKKTDNGGQVTLKFKKGVKITKLEIEFAGKKGGKNVQIKFGSKNESNFDITNKYSFAGSEENVKELLIKNVTNDNKNNPQIEIRSIVIEYEI